MKHKPTSINEPSHRLAISLHTPRANRWRMFCAHLRWYLSGCCDLESVLWMSLSIYIGVAKVYCCMCVLFNYQRSIYDSYFKGECRLWKAGSLMKSPQNAGKRPSMHPHSRRPKSHTHSFCHPSLSDACFCIRVTKSWKNKKTMLSFILLKNSLMRTKTFPQLSTNSIFLLQSQLIKP